MKNKFITFPQDHQLLIKDELKENVYCKYHNSWNHSTSFCWSFRNVIQDMVIPWRKGSHGEFHWRKISHSEVIWRKGSHSEVL